MNIVIVGGTGTIGRAVVMELKKRHTVIVAGHKTGDIQMDMTNAASIESMYQSLCASNHTIDAVIVTTGKVKFAELSAFTAEDYLLGLQHKLMGQVNIVLIGQRYLNECGSFTLTSGILNRDPIRMGTSAAMVNGALEGFVKNAAIELTRGMRINIVSPTVVMESIPQYEAYFRGFKSVSASDVALAYSKSVEGLQTGQVYCV